MRVNINWFIKRWYFWLMSCGNLLDGILGVFSLGFLRTGFGYKMCLRFTFWQAKWAATKEKERSMEWLRKL